MTAVGCRDNAGVAALRRAVDAMEDVADLLKSVKDQASAQEATAAVEPAYTEMIEAMNALADV